jgi:DNA polymerase
MRLIQEGPRTPGGILLCGEAPGQEEDRSGRPFSGISGWELDKELSAAGLLRSQLFITNVCHERPPGNEIEKFFATKTEAKNAPKLDTLSLANAASRLAADITVIAGRCARRPVIEGLVQLQKDIDALRPRLIIAMGNTALWALTGHTGIRSWRGSIMEASGGPVDGKGIKLIPAVHTASVLREYQWKGIVIHDLKRALRESRYPEVRRPTWSFTVPSSLHELRDWLGDNFATLPEDAYVTADVENDYSTERVHDARIYCLGLAVDPHTACCVPFAHRAGDNPHWWASPEEERDAVLLLRDYLRRRPVLFHNGLHDCQVIAHNWGWLPRFTHDSMVAQHTLFPAQLGGKIDPITGRTSKSGSSYSLLFCSSIYCDYHRYWKDDGKGWDPSIHDELQYWHYNCEDLVRTHEVFAAQRQMLHSNKLWEQYEFLMSLFPAVFEMMFAGLAFDDTARRTYRADVERQIKEAQAWINEAVGHPLNVESSQQMQRLFYEDLRLKPILHRKTRQPTVNDHALERFKIVRPILRPLVERIQAVRSLAVYKENFLDMRLSRDGRLRPAINVAGPETYRFSMNHTALGEAGNLQNLPRMEE